MLNNFIVRLNKSCIEEIQALKTHLLLYLFVISNW